MITFHFSISNVKCLFQFSIQLSHKKITFVTRSTHTKCRTKTTCFQSRFCLNNLLSNIVRLFALIFVPLSNIVSHYYSPLDIPKSFYLCYQNLLRGHHKKNTTKQPDVDCYKNPKTQQLQGCVYVFSSGIYLSDNE